MLSTLATVMDLLSPTLAHNVGNDLSALVAQANQSECVAAHGTAESQFGTACDYRFDPAPKGFYQTLPAICGFGCALLLEPRDDHIAGGS